MSEPYNDEEWEAVINLREQYEPGDLVFYKYVEIDRMIATVKRLKKYYNNARGCAVLAEQEKAQPFYSDYIRRWNVVSFNHYFLKGTRFAYIVLERNGTYHKDEGIDALHFWEQLNAQLASKEDIFL